MARMVATKAALSIRVDALTDADGKSEPAAPSIGIENRGKLESRLRALEHQLEGGTVRRFAGENSGRKQQRFEMTGETRQYNTAADNVNLVPTQREDPEEVALKVVLDVKEEKKKAKEERRAMKKAEKQKLKETTPEAEDDEDEEEEGGSMDVDGESKTKKEKKRKRRESDQNAPVAMDEDEPETSTKVSRYFLLSLVPNIVHFQAESSEERKARRKAKKEMKAAAVVAGSDSPKKKKKKSEA
jgi:nucleolar protein 58